ncbi:MAG: flippase-like domain-containing protein [Tannerella sp.]|jgi:uncharacterized membrane protein YbhN (UPF0104 family)|nr:flippase-like domain-containing protein [Tannerella sp.]
MIRDKLMQCLKIIIPLMLGMIILYFLYAKTDFGQLWTSILETNWTVLTCSLIFGLSGNLIRGMRWDLLIRPLGYRPRKSNLIYAVLGNYAVNFALPRAGEIWRCGVVAKKEKIPLVKLIGTLIVDRLFDMLMVALIFLLAISVNAKVFYRNMHEFNLPSFLVSPSFYGILALLLLLAVSTLMFFRKNFIVRKILSFFVSLWKDLLQIRRMEHKMRFVGYTLGIWISYFLYFYITFYAFDFTAELGLAAGIFVFAVSSLSMGIPSNGGLGPWQAAIVFGLLAFRIDLIQAKTFATVVFTYQSLWTVLCGLFGIAMFSIRNGRTNKLSQDNIS